MRLLFAASAAVALLMLALVVRFGPEDRPRNEERAICAELVGTVELRGTCGHAHGCACEELSSLPTTACDHELEVCQHVICPHCGLYHSQSYVVFAELERSPVPRANMKTPTSGDGPFDEHALARPEISIPEVSAVGVLA